MGLRELALSCWRALELVVVLLGQKLSPHGNGRYSLDCGEGVLVLQVGEYVAVFVLMQYFYRYAP
jgi:hypothetical protein